jgi:outer membrane protein OmpA-like peptidoglycan-associated protein
LNGISKNRITVKSYGEERPVVSGQNEESYAKNRRVEIN